MIATLAVFALLGFLVGRVLQPAPAVVLIVLLAVLWGVGSTPLWGLAALGEMLLGFVLNGLFRRR